MWLLSFALLVTCFVSGNCQISNLQYPVKPDVGSVLPDPVKPDVDTVLRLVADLTQQIEELKKFRATDLGKIAAMEVKLDYVLEENHSIKQRIKILETNHGPNGQEPSQSAQQTEHTMDVRRSLRQLFVAGNPNRNVTNAMTEHSDDSNTKTEPNDGKLATNGQSEQETMDPYVHTGKMAEPSTGYKLTRPGGSVRVAASNIVAFSAKLSSDKAVPEDDYIIKFDYVTTNTGNNYHPMTGVFIAPTDGVYVFSWSIGMATFNGYINTELMKNGAITEYLNTVADVYSEDSSQTSVLELSQGDVVAISVSTFTTSAELWRYHTSFKGFLLN